MLVRIKSTMKVNNLDQIVNLHEKLRGFILIRFIDDVVTFSHLISI